MEDGQDHQDGGVIGAGSSAMPPAEPPIGPTDEFVEAAVYGDATSDDVDETGLTGVLAALEETDPDEVPVPSEPVTADAVAAATMPATAENELAALQGALDAEETAPQVAPAESAEIEPEVGMEPALEPEVVTAVAADSAAVAAAEQPAYADTAEMAFPEQRSAVPIWPFLVYFGLWVVFAGLLVWQFMQTPAGVPLYELALYGPSILAGLVLTAFGPLLAIGVWIMLWMARPGARAGLFSRTLIMGAVVTLAGVALWLVALGAVDMLRLGRLI